jgi:hypothetical protein
VHDAPELLALGVDDVEPARTAAIDVSGGITAVRLTEGKISA